MDFERLQLASDITNVAEVAAVIMHEGLANICLLTSTMTIVKSKIDVQVRLLAHFALLKIDVYRF